MEILHILNTLLGLLFFLCFAYQILYIFLPFLMRDRPHKPTSSHRYAILIAARNEERVIPYLLQTLREQDYPAELFTVFVIADNCTDRTAEAARAGGAIVFERQDTVHVGKGYALDALLTQIHALYGDDAFDAYMVFDADNLLAPDFLSAMNRTFSDGYRIITSYRNSKNHGDNWISSGYALWFMRESCFLNHPRMLLGSSCAVAGTGFCVAREVLEATNGWKFFLLSEDTEFTIDAILRGERIAYCREAMLYDEQPTKFKPSWHQRMRWAKGYLQVFGKYAPRLLRGIFRRGGFACFDMCMCTMPAIVLGALGILLHIATSAAALIEGIELSAVLMQSAITFAEGYVGLFLLGAITTAAEWKRIGTTTAKKIGYLFTFPLFMMTYLPIAVTAIFRRVEWKPIEHTAARSLEEVKLNRD